MCLILQSEISAVQSDRIKTLSLSDYHDYQWRIQDFPEGANSQVGVILQILCQKLHENERIWTGEGRVPGAPSPLDPPMIIHCTCMLLQGIEFCVVKYQFQVLELAIYEL